MPRSHPFPTWNGSRSLFSSSSSSCTSTSSSFSSYRAPVPVPVPVPAQILATGSNSQHHSYSHSYKPLAKRKTPSTARLKRWISTHLLPRLDTSVPNSSGYYSPKVIRSATDYSQSQPSSRTMIQHEHGQERIQHQGQQQDQGDISPQQDSRFAGFDYDYEYEQYRYRYRYEDREGGESDTDVDTDIDTQSQFQLRHRSQSRSRSQHHLHTHSHSHQMRPSQAEREAEEEEDLVLSDNYAAYCRAFTSSPTSPLNNIPALPLPRFQTSEEYEEEGSTFANALWDLDDTRHQAQNQNQAPTQNEHEHEHQNKGHPSPNSPDGSANRDSAQDASQIRFLPVGAHGYHPASWAVPDAPSPPPGILTPARYEEMQQRRIQQRMQRTQQRRGTFSRCMPIRAAWWPWAREKKSST